eukprot:RCo053724
MKEKVQEMSRVVQGAVECERTFGSSLGLRKVLLSAMQFPHLFPHTLVAHHNLHLSSPPDILLYNQKFGSAAKVSEPNKEKQKQAKSVAKNNTTTPRQKQKQYPVRKS